MIRVLIALFVGTLLGATLQSEPRPISQRIAVPVNLPTDTPVPTLEPAPTIAPTSTPIPDQPPIEPTPVPPCD